MTHTHIYIYINVFSDFTKYLLFISDRTVQKSFLSNNMSSSEVILISHQSISTFGVDLYNDEIAASVVSKGGHLFSLPNTLIKQS